MSESKSTSKITTMPTLSQEVYRPNIKAPDILATLGWKPEDIITKARALRRHIEEQLREPADINRTLSLQDVYDAATLNLPLSIHQIREVKSLAGPLKAAGRHHAGIESPERSLSRADASRIKRITEGLAVSSSHMLARLHFQLHFAEALLGHIENRLTSLNIGNIETSEQKHISNEMRLVLIAIITIITTLTSFNTGRSYAQGDGDPDTLPLDDSLPTFLRGLDEESDPAPLLINYETAFIRAVQELGLEKADINDAVFVAYSKTIEEHPELENVDLPAEVIEAWNAAKNIIADSKKTPDFDEYDVNREYRRNRLEGEAQAIPEMEYPEPSTVPLVLQTPDGRLIPTQYTLAEAYQQNALPEAAVKFVWDNMIEAGFEPEFLNGEFSLIVPVPDNVNPGSFIRNDLRNVDFFMLQLRNDVRVDRTQRIFNRGDMVVFIDMTEGLGRGELATTLVSSGQLFDLAAEVAARENIAMDRSEFSYDRTPITASSSDMTLTIILSDGSQVKLDMRNVSAAGVTADHLIFIPASVGDSQVQRNEQGRPTAVVTPDGTTFTLQTGEFKGYKAVSAEAPASGAAAMNYEQFASTNSNLYEKALTYFPTQISTLQNNRIVDSTINPANFTYTDRGDGFIEATDGTTTLMWTREAGWTIPQTTEEDGVIILLATSSTSPNSAKNYLRVYEVNLVTNETIESFANDPKASWLDFSTQQARDAFKDVRLEEDLPLVYDQENIGSSMINNGLLVSFSYLYFKTNNPSIEQLASLQEMLETNQEVSVETAGGTWVLNKKPIIIINNEANTSNFDNSKGLPKNFFTLLPDGTAVIHVARNQQNTLTANNTIKLALQFFVESEGFDTSNGTMIGTAMFPLNDNHVSFPIIIQRSDNNGNALSSDLTN